MEYIELGPVPAGEPCAQVGTDNYLARSMRECEVFRRMLERVLPIPEGLPVKYVVRPTGTITVSTSHCAKVSTSAIVPGRLRTDPSRPSSPSRPVARCSSASWTTCPTGWVPICRSVTTT